MSHPLNLGMHNTFFSFMKEIKVDICSSVCPGIFHSRLTEVLANPRRCAWRSLCCAHRSLGCTCLMHHIGEGVCQWARISRSGARPSRLLSHRLWELSLACIPDKAAAGVAGRA